MFSARPLDRSRLHSIGDNMRHPFIALIANYQVPQMEFVGMSYQSWRIWLSYNKEKTAGTYLNLFNDGSITRETVSPTGEVTNVMIIKRK